MDLVTWFFVCKDMPRLVMMKNYVRSKVVITSRLQQFLTELRHCDN